MLQHRIFVKKLFILSIIIFGCLTNLKAQEHDTINLSDESGLKQGFWSKSDQYGRKVYEGQFVDDIPVGTFKYFYDNGRVKAVSEISAGGQNSYTTMFHPNGRKMSEGKYVNRERDSVWLIYDVHGQLLTGETYKNGRLHGRHVTFYQNGDTAEVVHYENGLRENSWLQYHRNGNLKTRGFLRSDTIHDTTTFYYRSGQKRLTAKYDMGKPVGEWQYFLEDGRPEKIEYYENGELVRREIFVDVQMEAGEE